MDDPVLVRRLERFRDLPDNLQGLANRDGAAGYAIGQGRSLDQLHDDRRGVAGFLESVNLGDVRMVQ